MYSTQTAAVSAATISGELFRSRKLAVLLFVMANAAMLAAGLMFPKGYVASTTILVDDRNIVQPLMQGAAVATEITDRARNAREIIFGRRIMQRVLESGGWQEASPTPAQQERLMEDIRKRTSITSVGRNIIRIEYRDDEAERAHQTTRLFADLFIQASIAAKRAESSAAYEFIDKQAREYQETLARTEEQLRELRSSNLNARAGTEAEVTARMNTLQVRIEQAMQELREAEIRGKALERQVSGEIEVTAAATRESQYRTRIAELQTRLDVLRLSYFDTHPDVVQLKHQIRELNEAIDEERERREQMRRSGRISQDPATLNNPVYQQLRRDLSQNQLTVEALRARIADGQQRLQAEMSRAKLLHSGDARLAELTRDYQVNRDIYQDLLRRRENARVSMNLDSERQGLTLRVQEPATLPLHPTGLRFWHFVAGGFLLGLALPIGLVYLRLQFDERIRSASALAGVEEAPVIAVLPHMWTPRAMARLRWELAALALLVLATIGSAAALSVMRVFKIF